MKLFGQMRTGAVRMTMTTETREARLAEAVAAWEQWLSTRPESIQTLGAYLQPWKRYKLHNSTCRLVSFNEDGTVTVRISREDNRDNAIFMFEREVFGVPPDDLHEVLGDDDDL